MCALEPYRMCQCLHVIHFGLQINATDLLGNTPLHVACSTGQVRTYTLLID
jgi:ankyrin repeat protein